MKVELIITYIDNEVSVFNVYIPKNSTYAISDLVYFKDGILEFDYQEGMTEFIPYSSIKSINRIVTE